MRGLCAVATSLIYGTTKSLSPLPPSLPPAFSQSFPARAKLPFHFHYLFLHRSRFIVSLLNLLSSAFHDHFISSCLLKPEKERRDRTPPQTHTQTSAIQIQLLRKICGQASHTTTRMHAAHTALLVNYCYSGNAAKLRESCLAEVTALYIFPGLLCKAFPLGCITCTK